MCCRPAPPPTPSARTAPVACTACSALLSFSIATQWQEASHGHGLGARLSGTSVASRRECQRSVGEDLFRQHGVDAARAVHDLGDAEVNGDTGEAVCFVP